MIVRLLTVDPEQRLGSGVNGIEDIQNHPFLKQVNWSTLLHQPAVFVPTPDNELDTAYFVQKDDNEGIAEWSYDAEDDSEDSEEDVGEYTEYSEYGQSGDFSQMGQSDGAIQKLPQFLGFSFRNLDHLKELNIGEKTRKGGCMRGSDTPQSSPQSPPLSPGSKI